VQGFKDHPLYVLRRHLLKFEAIYPPDVQTVGEVRGEPVYPRSAVFTLHSAQNWRKEARTVRAGEEPYKIVQARPKLGVPKERIPEDRPLPVFGVWQTDDFVPPVAENVCCLCSLPLTCACTVQGIVPRNEYGNVELFHECMLPLNTRHIRGHPRLADTARRLDIDCVAAMIGWDVHGGRSHAALDGWVVCTEQADRLLDEYEREEVVRAEKLARVGGAQCTVSAIKK
jgi:xeroderma pigmentosum group C-complementing protein